MNAPKVKTVHKELGDKIKTIRMEKNMKIIDVARITGLTSSMISQVERSLISPSIDTLKKIGKAFNMPVSYFFDDGENEEAEESKQEELKQEEFKPEIIQNNVVVERSPVVRPHQRKILSPGKGVTYYLLNPDMSGPIEFIYNIYEPGTGTGFEQYTHEGYECGLILEGELVVTISDKVYRLQKGDSITFCSEEPHSKTNEGSVPCICIWANNPPFF